MSSEFLDRIDGLADLAGQLLPAGIWILVALFGFIASMRDRSKKRTEDGQPQSPARTSPSPYAPAPARGSTYGSLSTVPPPEQRRDAPDDAQPTYGSHDKAVWGSVFDEPGEDRKWGFDESEWGSSFGPKKNSEPTISQS